jgi:formate--tetrahydrofolate ligase
MTASRSPRDIKAEGAMTALLKDALKPNLVQTLEGTPAFVHGGPFANIAHGCNSVMATRMALKLGDYASPRRASAPTWAREVPRHQVPHGGPQARRVVVVATVRALKHNGGVPRPTSARRTSRPWSGPAQPAAACREHHEVYGCPAWWPSTRSPPTPRPSSSWSRTNAELGVNVALSRCGPRAARAASALAEEVVRLCEQPNDFRFSYDST